MASFAVIACQKATKKGLDCWCNHLRPRVIYLLKDDQRIDFRAWGHLPLYLDSSRIGYFRWPILVLPRGDVDPVSLPSQVLGEADVCMFNPQMLIFPVVALLKDMQARFCHIPLTLFDAGGRAPYITCGSWGASVNILYPDFHKVEFCPELGISKIWNKVGATFGTLHIRFGLLSSAIILDLVRYKDVKKLES